MSAHQLGKREEMGIWFDVETERLIVASKRLITNWTSIKKSNDDNKRVNALLNRLSLMPNPPRLRSEQRQRWWSCRGIDNHVKFYLQAKNVESNRLHGVFSLVYDIGACKQYLHNTCMSCLQGIFFIILWACSFAHFSDAEFFVSKSRNKGYSSIHSF